MVWPVRRHVSIWHVSRLNGAKVGAGNDVWTETNEFNAFLDFSDVVEI